MQLTHLPHDQMPSASLAGQRSPCWVLMFSSSSCLRVTFRCLCWWCHLAPVLRFWRGVLLGPATPLASVLYDVSFSRRSFQYCAVSALGGAGGLIFPCGWQTNPGWVFGQQTIYSLGPQLLCSARPESVFVSLRNTRQIVVEQSVH